MTNLTLQDLTMRQLPTSPEFLALRKISEGHTSLASIHKAMNDGSALTTTSSRVRQLYGKGLIRDENHDQKVTGLQLGAPLPSRRSPNTVYSLALPLDDLKAFTMKGLLLGHGFTLEEALQTLVHLLESDSTLSSNPEEALKTLEQLQRLLAAKNVNGAAEKPTQLISVSETDGSQTKLATS